jgi:hypothetical protein
LFNQCKSADENALQPTINIRTMQRSGNSGANYSIHLLPGYSSPSNPECQRLKCVFVLTAVTAVLFMDLDHTSPIIRNKRFLPVLFKAGVRSEYYPYPIATIP